VPNDEDVVSFEFDRNNTADPVQGVVDVELLDGNGNVLASSFTSRERPGEEFGVQGEEPFFEFEFATAGTFFVQISGRNGDAVGDYFIDLVPGDANDTIDPGSAIIFNFDASQDAQLAFGGDVDMYRVDLPTDSTWGFDLDVPSFSASLDTFVRVFDDAGNELAFNDDGTAPGENPGLASFVSLDLAAGTYFVGVSDFGNELYDPVTGSGDNDSGSDPDDVGFYTLDVLNLGTPEVDFAASNFEFGQNIGFFFNEPIDLASYDPSDFIVEEIRTNTIIPTERFNPFISGNGIFLDYDITTFGTLPDGDYNLTLLDGALTDLDGNANQGEVTSFVTFFLAGDANRDRTVDLVDFTTLRNNFGRSDSPLFSEADFNYDGTVDLADFTILRNQFGKDLFLTIPPVNGSLFVATEEQGLFA
jgi:hypothetical protein